MKKILFSLFMGCAILFTGCDKGDDETPQTPTPTPVVTDKNLTDIVWGYQSMALSVEFNNAQAGVLFAPYLAMMNSQLSSMSDSSQTLLFKTDGTCIFADSEGSSTGTYVQSGNTLTITDPDQDTQNATYSISNNILSMQYENPDQEVNAQIESILPTIGAPEGSKINHIYVTIKFKAK